MEAAREWQTGCGRRRVQGAFRRSRQHRFASSSKKRASMSRTACWAEDALQGAAHRAPRLRRLTAIRPSRHGQLSPGHGAPVRRYWTVDDRPEIGEDVGELFNYLTTGYGPAANSASSCPDRSHLKPALLERIERERALGAAGAIHFKMNALEDADITRALYRAAQAGVQIELCIRDTCRLRPGLPGLSESVRVVSIVGRFLEHARVYYFRNGGAEEYFIGSADSMRRNLEQPRRNPRADRRAGRAQGVARRCWTFSSRRIGTRGRCARMARTNASRAARTTPAASKRLRIGSAIVTPVRSPRRTSQSAAASPAAPSITPADKSSRPPRVRASPDDEIAIPREDGRSLGRLTAHRRASIHTGVHTRVSNISSRFAPPAPSVLLGATVLLTAVAPSSVAATPTGPTMVLTLRQFPSGTPLPWAPSGTYQLVPGSQVTEVAPPQVFGPGTPQPTYSFLFWNITSDIRTTASMSFTAPSDTSTFDVTAWYIPSGPVGPPGPPIVSTYAFSLNQDKVIAGTPIGSVTPPGTWAGPPATTVSTTSSASPSRSPRSCLQRLRPVPSLAAVRQRQRFELGPDRARQ